MIEAIIEIFSSKMDRNGNRYWAFRYTDTNTGSKVELKADACSNVEHAMGRRFNYDHARYKVIIADLPIREFNQLVKDWPYGDGNGIDKLNAAIDSKLGLIPA